MLAETFARRYDETSWSPTRFGAVMLAIVMTVMGHGAVSAQEQHTGPAPQATAVSVEAITVVPVTAEADPVSASAAATEVSAGSQGGEGLFSGVSGRLAGAGAGAIVVVAVWLVLQLGKMALGALRSGHG